MFCRFWFSRVSIVALATAFAGGAIPSGASVAWAQPKIEILDDAAEPSVNISLNLQKGSGPFKLLFDRQDERNFYALEADATSATFARVLNGKREVLTTSPVSWSASSRVVLQRRPFLMQLLVNDSVALRAFDATWNEGEIGIIAGAWKTSDVRVQPLESVRFDDDFTRADRAGDDNWKAAGAPWALTASSELINTKNAAMSSNPFAYSVATPSGASLAHAGRWFWDSYDVRANVRPEGRGEVGVAAYVQDAKNYLAFRWSSQNRDDARRLVLVKDGKETVLASGKGSFLPHTWYRIGLRLSPGYVEALMDDIPVLRAKTEALGQGGVGMWAKDIARATFDDVRVRSYDFLRADFAQNGAWQPQSGAWKWGGGFANGSDPKNAPRVLTTGAPDWDGYRAFVSARPKSGQSFGFVVGWKNARNYSAWRVSGSKQEIVRVSDGQEKVLFSAPVAVKFDDWARFQIGARGGVFTIESNGQVLAQVVGKNLTDGHFGLWASGPGSVAFSDAVVFFPPAPEPLKAAPKMEDDAYMVGWASSTGEWPPSPGADGLEFWNVGEFFGDALWQFPWRSRGRGQLEMAIRAERGKFDSGYLLRAAVAEDGKNVNWTLLRGDKVLAQAQTPQTGVEGTGANANDEVPIEVRTSGNSLLVALPDGPVLSHVDPNPPSGSAVALRTKGFRLRADKLHSFSQNRDDTMFTEAPVEFYSLAGDWRVISRWPCKGDWSFFGGAGRAPILWSKRTYSGDVVAQMYAHPQMDLPKEVGYSHPGDLNIALAGDGRDLSSAYNFVVAGEYNTRHKIMRGDRVLAQTGGGEVVFTEAHNRNNGWHRKWFAVRAEARRAVKDGKSGVRLALFLDDKPVLETFDADPLPTWEKGGRVAMWTLDSTLTIARARIEAAEMSLPTLPANLELPSSDVRPSGAAWWPVAVEDANRPTASVEKSGNGWKITNPMSGNLFAVDLNASPLQATPATKWRMNANIPSDVKVDLYLEIGGEWRVVELTGNQKPDGLAPSLGKAQHSGDSFSFDVGTALAKAFPNEKTWPIERIRLGALHGNPYRWAGLDGNPHGASYTISDWNWQ